MMQLRVSYLSKPGDRSVNEDACGFWSHTLTGACFCVVSDGAGGHGGGDVASKLVVEHVLSWFHARPQCTPAAVDAALRTANDILLDRQHDEIRLADMRATAVVLALDVRRGIAVWGHLGDSRLYHFRGGRVVFQTRDHSVVQSMVDAGYVDATEVRRNPKRGSLLAALGDADGVSPAVVPIPRTIQRGDMFVLCTDGLWEHVEEYDMERILGVAGGPERWLREIEATVLAAGAVSHDNYSALVIACE